MKTIYAVNANAFTNVLKNVKILPPQALPGEFNGYQVCCSDRVKISKKVNVTGIESKKWLITILLIISVLFSIGQTNFTLTAPAKTSAGIYKQDGSLIRTLWGNIYKDAGTYPIKWDGTDDNFQPVPAGSYNVKVLNNNVNYTWEGVVGNTSSSFTGTTVHKGYLRMYSMVVSGTTAYYSNYYNEGHSSQFKFDLSNPQSRTELFSYGQSTLYNATDGKTVYWAGDDVLGGHNNWFVFGTNISNDAETSFSNGQSYPVQYGRTYASVIDLVNDKNANITGLAVQKAGNYLFISRQNVNQVHVLDKTTGALVRILTVNSPQRLAVDGSDNLWLVSADGINKYIVNGDGTLGSVLTTIRGILEPWAIAVSPDNSKVTIADGSASQQVKSFDNATGAAIWTYGQAGGYSTSPDVTNDKFYFTDAIHNNDGTFIAYQPDGSFWVEDAGNYRAQHFAEDRSYIERIMYLPGFYGASADPNNPNKVFADFLEFNVDYSKPLAPANGSWSLTKNWRHNLLPSYSVLEGLRAVTTLSNGRTYTFVRHFDKYAVAELAGTGMRITGYETDNLNNQLQKDGTILEWGGGPVGQPFGAGVHALTGFDGSNNPIWSGNLTQVGSTEAMIGSDPNSSGSGNVVKTSSDVYVTFDAGVPPNSSTDYHLGGFKANDNHWLWKTAKSTFTAYSGPFPSDGGYDIGNGVVYGGSVAIPVDRSVIWGYHGEFWKGGETNFYTQVYDDGLTIGQFGTAEGGNAPAGLAGNALSLATVNVGNEWYMYNNDESVHGGLHRWKISGLNTVSEQVIPIDASFVRTDENPVLPGVDLMAGLPFDSFLPNAFGWQNSDPNVYDGATLTWWYGKTNNLAFHKRTSPDVYITFHQNAYLTRSITRDLGNNSDLTSWKLAGVINYNNSLPDGLGGVTFLEVLDNNDRVIARLNHEVIFGANNSKTTNMYGNYNLIHTDQSDSFSLILWKDQPVQISGGAGGITFNYANFAPVTVPILDPASNWQAPTKMRVYISGGGGYDRRIDLISMRFISNAAAQPPVADTSLSNLVLSQGTLSPVFVQTTGSYTALVVNSITSITVTPTASGAGSTIMVNNTTVASGTASGSIALNEGNNIITTVVTTQDGTATKTYTVNLTRTASDTSLSNLILSQGTLSPVFIQTMGSYTATVANSTSSITETPTASGAGSTITVNNTTVISGSPSGSIALAEGSNIITTVVTAQNGTATKTYTIDITRAAASGSNCESTPTQAYTSNTTTGNQAHRGELGMEFVVHNPAGVLVKQLGAFDDGGNGITGLQPGGGIRVAIFNRATHNIIPGLDVIIIGMADAYTGNHRMKNITPVNLPPGDYVIVAKGYNAGEQNGNLSNGGGAYPVGGDGGGAITFGNETSFGPDNPNGFNYPSTAGNYGTVHQFLAGTFVFTSTIPCVTSNNANLSGLVLSQGALAPVFAQTTTSYNASVSNNTTSITVAPTAAGAGSTIMVNNNIVASGSPSGAIPLSEGSNVITTVVTAQDGITTMIYTVIVTRAAASGSCESMPAQAYASNTQSGNQGYRGELGMQFIVNNTGGIIINQLGAFDDGGNGLTGLQPGGGVRVAIFNRATHTIVPGLDAIIIGNADHYTGNHRMKDIAPVTLPPGDYVIVAKGYNAGEKNGNSVVGGGPYPAGDTGGGAITFGNETSYGPDDPSGFSYPATSGNYGNSPIYAAGTFVFTTAIPCVTLNNANLSNLVLSQGTLAPAFAQATTSYNASVLNSTTSINVTPTVAGVGATIKVNNIDIASGSPSGAITLAEGSNIISVVITAQDGTTTKTYTVNVSRAAGGNCESQPAQAYIANTQTGNNAHRGELGMEFIVNNPSGIIINQIGAFDDGGNGITGLQPGGGVRVAIFNRATHNIVPGLDVTVIGNADHYTGNHRMKDIAPVTLPSGDYVIVAKGYNSGEKNGNSTVGGESFPVGDNGGGAITFGNETSYGPDDPGGFSYPVSAGNFGNSPIFLAGTFNFTTIINCPIATTAASVIQVEEPKPASIVKTKDVKIYPNPTSGQFTVQLPDVSASKIIIQVMNSNGKLIEQKSIEVTTKTSSLNVPFNLADQSPGIYIIKVASPGEIRTGKFVIQR